MKMHTTDVGNFAGGIPKKFQWTAYDKVLDFSKIQAKCSWSAVDSVSRVCGHELMKWTFRRIQKAPIPLSFSLDCVRKQNRSTQVITVCRRPISTTKPHNFFELNTEHQQTTDGRNADASAWYQADLNGWQVREIRLFIAQNRRNNGA